MLTLKTSVSILATLLSITFANASTDINHTQKASASTIEANKAIENYLPFYDVKDFNDVKRGFIADIPHPVIVGEDGHTIINLSQYDFIKGKENAPDTVNPSLWRQARLLNVTGLFKVMEGVYQVRGIDIANITFIKGKTGWIVIDPLTSVETAKAALELVNDKVEHLPVSAVIITHSHVDHFAGLRGVVNEADVKSGKIPLIAPEGFIEEAVSENVFAGNVMSRRASYMYGTLLPHNAEGNVSSGLGLTTAAGTVTVIQPNKLIKNTGEKATVDGLDVEFQMAPGTEAPAEMLFYFPQLKLLDLAEDASHTMHNILTPRGAKVRNPDKWAKALNQTLEMWGQKAAISVGSHHWPTWGNAEIVEHLEKQRDLYRYINDQTLRMANQGMTMNQIADAFTLPDSLGKEFFNRGYYGNLKHNVRATYQLYLGFWDANPANYDPLSPADEARKYVEMVGADKMIKTAKDALSKGDYRWAATLANKVVFTDPKNKDARETEANALEQLGYQAESAPARNIYLTGAMELRNGVRKMATPNANSPDIITNMSVPAFLDFLAIHLNGPRVGDKTYVYNWVFPDINEQYVITVKNGVLNYEAAKPSDKADGTITMNRSTLNDIALGKLKLWKLPQSEGVSVAGDRDKLKALLSNFDKFDFWFTIGEP
ncbi:MBL fold metallo-hydrolase [Salmonella enterica]|nr:MBL fold metallo-hydrolase [Salmonella enterica]